MFATVNGIKLYYEDIGQGPAIIFIHGLGENASSWRHQIAEFSKHYRVVAMDLRGHGQSDYNEEIITMKLFARDVLVLLDQLNIDKGHFVGHSMGGLISQEIAVHHLDKMLSMTLSDSAGYYPSPMGTTGLEIRLHNIDTMAMSEMAEVIANGACRPSAPEAIKDEVRILFSANRKVPYRQATISTLQADYREHHAKMILPVLLMVGEFDQTTPLEYALFLHTVLAGACLEIVGDAAHMTKLENPQEYNRLLAEFLKKLN